MTLSCISFPCSAMWVSNVGRETNLRRKNVVIKEKKNGRAWKTPTKKTTKKYCKPPCWLTKDWNKKIENWYGMKELKKWLRSKSQRHSYEKYLLEQSGRGQSKGDIPSFPRLCTFLMWSNSSGRPAKRFWQDSKRHWNVLLLQCVSWWDCRCSFRIILLSHTLQVKAAFLLWVFLCRDSLDEVLNLMLQSPTSHAYLFSSVQMRRCSLFNVEFKKQNKKLVFLQRCWLPYLVPEAIQGENL